jgi:hypothetical protein
MDPLQQLEAAGEATHSPLGDRSPSTLDLNLASELALLEGLERVHATLDAHEHPAAIARLRLSAQGAGEMVGNPADWRGFVARSVAVWNHNAFSVYLGSGAGTGTPERRIVTVTANRLVLLPIEDEVYSVGTDAANIAAADALVFAARYRQVFPPAAYAIA